MHECTGIIIKSFHLALIFSLYVNSWWRLRVGGWGLNSLKGKQKGKGEKGAVKSISMFTL